MNRSNMKIIIPFGLLILSSLCSVISGVNLHFLLVRYYGQSASNKHFNKEYNYSFQDATQLFVYEQEKREELVRRLRRGKEERKHELQAPIPQPLISIENRATEKMMKKLKEAESQLKTDPLCNGDESELKETCLLTLENSYYEQDGLTFYYDGDDDERKPTCSEMNVVIEVGETMDKKTSPECTTANKRDQVRGVHKKATTSECTSENQKIQTDETLHVNKGPSGQPEKEVWDAEQQIRDPTDDEGVEDINDKEEIRTCTTENQRDRDTEQEQRRMGDPTDDTRIQGVDDNQRLPLRIGAKYSKIYKRFMLACPMIVSVNDRERVSPMTLFFSATDRYGGDKKRLNVYVFEHTIDHHNPNIKQAVLDMTTVRVVRLQMNKKRTSKPQKKESSKHTEDSKNPSKGEHHSKDIRDTQPSLDRDENIQVSRETEDVKSLEDKHRISFDEVPKH